MAASAEAKNWVTSFAFSSELTSCTCEGLRAKARSASLIFEGDNPSFRRRWSPPLRRSRSANPPRSKAAQRRPAARAWESAKHQVSGQTAGKNARSGSSRAIIAGASSSLYLPVTNIGPSDIKARSSSVKPIKMNSSGKPRSRASLAHAVRISSPLASPSAPMSATRTLPSSLIRGADGIFPPRTRLSSSQGVTRGRESGK